MDMHIEKKSSFTDFFIHHPIFSWVINLIVILLGIISFVKLPLRQYPVVAEPTITLVINDRSSSNPSLLENKVTRPLEEAFAGISGITSLESETERGSVRIFMTFNKNRSIDSAASDVLDLRANAKLPENLDFTMYRGNANTSENLLSIMLTTKSPRFPFAQLHNIAKDLIKSQIESIPGVSKVEIEGGSELQMVVRLDPLRLQTFQIDAAEVRRALQAHNFQLPTGNIKEKERDYALVATGCSKTCQQFAQIIVSSPEKDKFVRLGDVAELTIAPKETHDATFFNGNLAISLDVTTQNEGNPIEISKEINSRLDEIKKTLPKDVNVDVTFNTAEFIEESIFQVYKALFEAFVLVLVVILFFLRSFRASLIPLVTIPISLVGTFFFMDLLGFSLNTISLLALVLAIGLVVDDAIVVLENVYRYIEKGVKPFKAAILATREIRFSIIAMTLTLAAVYVPIAISPGSLGKIFREFALTLAAAVTLSGFTALTLSSVMCARMLKMSPHGEATSSSGWMQKLSGKIENALTTLDQKYGRGVAFSLKNRFYVIGLAILFCGLVVFWSMNFLKTELVPPSDEGLVSVSYSPPIGKNIQYIIDRVQNFDEKFLVKEGLFKDRYMRAKTSNNFVYLTLKPWKERKEKCQDLIEGLQSKWESNVLGLSNFQVTCKSSSVLDDKPTSSNEMTFRISTPQSMDSLIEVCSNVMRQVRKIPNYSSERWWAPARQMQYSYEINQERTAPFNIHPKDVADTIEILLAGNFLAGEFERDGIQYPVVLSVEQSFQKFKDQLNSLFVRGRDEKNNTILVPLGGMIEMKESLSEAYINHFMKQRSLELRIILKPGSDAYKTFLDFQKEQEKNLPPGYSLQPSGTLKTIVEETKTTYFIFIMASLFIFLVMAAQFESVRAPFIIMLTVPLALSSALIFLGFLKDGSFNIYSQIGLVTLIGLITKHGILIVDFANQKREEGVDLYEAIITACQMRLRPVLMTTLAMVFGALPLAFASGPGSEARCQIGTIIVGGMTFGTLFTLFVLPALYTWIIGKTRREIAEKNN